ncbi:MAG: hypothetical protein K2O15_12715 [Lachnospiraceae bacterium]|nr:hypothetical protein [Lachnospiraceae bacterium]
MRVTRNYRSSMLNFRKNSSQTASSLLNTLQRNSMSRRTNTLSSIFGNSKGSSTASSLFDKKFTTSSTTSTAKAQKFYYDMQYHAKQVGEYADALKSSKKDSIYDKARESGSTEQIVSDIKSFVNQYNNMLDDLKESGTNTDSVFLTQLNSLSRAASMDLAKTGVTRKSDGTLVIDEEKLAAADVDTLEKVWGGSGFSMKAGAKAGSVEATAERNIEAVKSSTYSPFNRTNLYGSTGRYFNSRR